MNYRLNSLAGSSTGLPKTRRRRTLAEDARRDGISRCAGKSRGAELDWMDSSDRCAARFSERTRAPYPGRLVPMDVKTRTLVQGEELPLDPLILSRKQSRDNTHCEAEDRSSSPFHRRGRCGTGRRACSGRRCSWRTNRRCPRGRSDGK